MSGRLRAEMAQRAALFRKLVDRFGDEILDVVSQHAIAQAEANLKAADIGNVFCCDYDFALPRVESRDRFLANEDPDGRRRLLQPHVRAEGRVTA